MGNSIYRAPKEQQKIVRKKPKEGFRNPDEIQAAQEQVGETSRRTTKSWYRDIYDFYQNNEY